MLANSTACLRAMMAGPDLIWGPGVYDGISARIASAAGFPMIYMTGSGTSASRMGEPDLGITALSEMVENARTIARSRTSRSIADADTGFGGPVNVARTVHLYEEAGVAGIHIEDQTFPKRCGHLAGRPSSRSTSSCSASAPPCASATIPTSSSSRAPMRARPNGFDDAIERIERAFDAGADVGFFEAPRSLAEDRSDRRARAGADADERRQRTGDTPNLRSIEVEELGFKFAILPAALTRRRRLAMRRACETLKQSGTDMEAVEGMSPRDFFEVMGLTEVLEIDARARENGAERRPMLQ